MLVLLQETITFGSHDSGGWIKLLPILISLLAFAVSFFTLYRNYLAPFKALITVGAPVYQFGALLPSAPNIDATYNAEFDPERRRILGAILVPLVFTHQSGKPGVISDLMLRVSREGRNDNWYFEPRLNVDERAYLTSFDAQSHQKWIESAFCPIPLIAGGQVNKLIMFQPDESPVFPCGRLRVGPYSIQVLAKFNDEKKYRTIDSVSFDFSLEVLTNLGNTNRFIPPPKSIAVSRDKLRGTSTSN